MKKKNSGKHYGASSSPFLLGNPLGGKMRTLAFGELPRGPQAAKRPPLNLGLIRRVQAEEQRGGRGMPCGCGSHDATWHGDSMRTYACDKCYKRTKNPVPDKREWLQDGINVAFARGHIDHSVGATAPKWLKAIAWDARVIDQLVALNGRSSMSQKASVLKKMLAYIDRAPAGKIDLYVGAWSEEIRQGAASTEFRGMGQDMVPYRRPNPVYDALIPNPVKIPFKLMQPRVSGRGLKTINKRLGE